MAMSWLTRIFLGAAMSWVASVALGLLFATMASGRFWLGGLRLPGVVPVALVVSTGVALVVTPIAVWSLRTGIKNCVVYGSILWIILAAYDVLVTPRSAGYGLYGLVLLAVVGLVILGLVPAPRDR